MTKTQRANQLQREEIGRKDEEATTSINGLLNMDSTGESSTEEFDASKFFAGVHTDGRQNANKKSFRKIQAQHANAQENTAESINKILGDSDTWKVGITRGDDGTWKVGITSGDDSTWKAGDNNMGNESLKCVIPAGNNFANDWQSDNGTWKVGITSNPAGYNFAND